MLSELAVAKELGISRTPVREAFRDFEQEGVLEQVPRFGTRVKALDRRDLVELYELREALEPYAVAQAAGRLSDADAHTLRDALRRHEGRGGGTAQARPDLAGRRHDEAPACPPISPFTSC